LLRREGHRRELREKKQYRIARENPFKDPAEAAAQREIQQLVREEIARLPKHYRVAVKARDIHEWSRKRTARLCKVPMQTISNWQFQGRLLLAKRMTRDYWGDERKPS
jgi:DNA-directed RNA polymerase specialized sigma24 family protein